MKKIFCSAVLCSALFGVNAAQSAVLTFDDIGPDSIANGYGGLNWSNMYALDTSTYTESGYTHGVVSGTNVAYNWFAQMGVVSNNDFTFNGAYFTAAWNDGLTVLAEGFKDGVQQYSLSYVIDTLSPTWLSFNFLNIDELRFSSFGGVDHGYNGGGANFAMDNFTFNENVNAVPVPAAVWLFGTGLMGLLGFNRKRAQSAA